MVEKGRFGTILTEKKDGVLWINFNRPHRMNAFDLEMLNDLSLAFKEAELDEEVRCVVIKGVGDRAFSSGADFTMFADLTPAATLNILEKGQQLMGRIEGASKPYIAAIHGYCLGGGLEFALACDFRVADESAQLGNPEIKRGLIPGWGGTQRLSRVVGLAKAKELIMIGDRITAKDALKIGLVHKVVSVGKLEEEVKALAQRMVEGPPVALKLAKRTINLSAQFPLEVGLQAEAQAVSIISSTEDIMEGISAFFERRKPEFKGK